MRIRAGLVCALLAIAALGSHLSGASFSDTKSNAGNSFSAAASFCNGGTQTVGASQDSYVDHANPTTNFGTGATLRVQTNTLVLLNTEQHALVQFSLPSIPAFCSVTSATLSLFSSSAASGRTIQAFKASGSWTETGVTWNNQPSTTGSAATASSGTGTISWTVTSQVQAMYSGTNNGFLLKDSNETALLNAAQVYQSREGTPNSQDPSLSITFG